MRIMNLLKRERKICTKKFTNGKQPFKVAEIDRSKNLRNKVKIEIARNTRCNLEMRMKS